MMAAPYVLRATPAKVDLWTCSRIPFEAGVRRPWKKKLVRDLNAATAGLEPEGESLAGMYATTQSILCDTENTLFTNPGAKAFPRDTVGIRWELDPSDPPSPPVPVADVGDGLHYYRYERTPTLKVWKRDLPLARWSRVQRRRADDGAARSMWLALRQALVRGEVSIFEWNIPQGTKFGLRIEIHAPSTGPRSAVAASETLVDGALSALHAGAPPPEAVMVAQILSRKLGIPPERLVELVEDRVALFQGSPFVLGNGYLQFSPCDELCVVGQVQIVGDPTIPVVETSGELFTVSLKDAAESESEPEIGAGLWGYLDSNLARDIALAEAANEWTASLPADHVVDAEHVIRTARADGSYVAAYEVPGPEIGRLHEELDTARLLAEVAAKRAIMELHSETEEGSCATCGRPGHQNQKNPVRFPCQTLLALALPYARMHDIEEMRQLHGW